MWSMLWLRLMTAPHSRPGLWSDPVTTKRWRGNPSLEPRFDRDRRSDARDDSALSDWADEGGQNTLREDPDELREEQRRR